MPDIRCILGMGLVVVAVGGCGGDCEVTLENRLTLDLTAVLFSPDTDDQWVWDHNLGESAPIEAGEERDFTLYDVGISRWDLLAVDSADASYDSMDHQCVGGWIELRPQAGSALPDAREDAALCVLDDCALFTFLFTFTVTSFMFTFAWVLGLT